MSISIMLENKAARILVLCKKLGARRAEVWKLSLHDIPSSFSFLKIL